MLEYLVYLLAGLFYTLFKMYLIFIAKDFDGCKLLKQKFKEYIEIEASSRNVLPETLVFERRMLTTVLTILIVLYFFAMIVAWPFFIIRTVYKMLIQ